jgi:hypothetical protein
MISETTWRGVSFFSLAWGTGRRLAFRARVLNGAGTAAAGTRAGQGRADVCSSCRRCARGAAAAGRMRQRLATTGRGSGLSGFRGEVTPTGRHLVRARRHRVCQCGRIGQVRYPHLFAGSELLAGMGSRCAEMGKRPQPWRYAAGRTERTRRRIRMKRSRRVSHRNTSFEMLRSTFLKLSSTN